MRGRSGWMGDDAGDRVGIKWVFVGVCARVYTCVGVGQIKVVIKKMR